MRRLAEGVPPNRYALRETGCSFSRDVSACNDSAISQTTVFRQSLALLSCAERISVISKKKGEEYVGGVIENPKLDEAITDDLTPQDYPLGQVNPQEFAKYTHGHSS